MTEPKLASPPRAPGALKRLPQSALTPQPGPPLSTVIVKVEKMDSPAGTPIVGTSRGPSPSVPAPTPFPFDDLVGEGGGPSAAPQAPRKRRSKPAAPAPVPAPAPAPAPVTRKGRKVQAPKRHALLNVS